MTTEALTAAAAPETRRRLSSWTPEECYSLLGAAGGALGLVWLLFERMLPFTGALAFWLCWYIVFTLAFAAASAMQWGARVFFDRVVTVVFHGTAFAVLTAIALVIGYTAYRGWAAIRPSFFTDTMKSTGPLTPLRDGGGVAHAMVGSLEQIALALFICVPLGMTAAVFLNEIRGPLARPVRMIVDAMSAIPSIVAGLFVLATLILTLGYNKCGLAAAIAISIEMLPVVTRSTELVLRLVPGGLREASYALGASQWRTVWRVVLPTARSGLATAIVLGIARGIGETAPVLLVAGFANSFNANPLRGSQVSLPYYIFNYVKYPQAQMITRAYGAALALLAIVLVLFIVARILGGHGPGRPFRRRPALPAPR